MESLDLYKLINFFNNCETRIDCTDAIAWIPFYKLSEFTTIIGYDFFTDGDIEVCLQYSCIAVDISDFTEAYGIYKEDLIDLID